MPDFLMYGPLPWWVAIAAGIAWLIVRHERAVKRQADSASGDLARDQEARARRACRPNGGVERLP